MRYKELNGIQAIYINNLMRTLALSLGGLFSPLYVFLFGYEGATLVAGLRVIILSIVVERVTVTVLAIPLGRLVYKMGFKWSVLWGSFLLSIYFLLPTVFDRSLVLIVVMSFLSALSILIYWIARNSLMSMDGDRGHYGHDVSYMAITERLVSILGPFVGGYLVATGGFQVLFAVVTIVSIISALPMFFMVNHKIIDGISLSGLVDFVKSKKNKHLNIAFFGQGLNNTVDGFLWPVFFFLVLGSYELMGGVTSMIMALTIFIIYLAGKKFDKQRAVGGEIDEVNFTKAGVWLAVLSFVRPLFAVPVSMIGHVFVFSASIPFWWIPHDGYLYSAGKRMESPLAFYVYREVVYSIGRFSLFLALYFFLGVISVNILWWVIFGLGGLGILLTIGLKKES